MAGRTTIFTDIDFDRNGKQISFLNLPHSPHTDAWGVTPIPIAVIRNGTGPTVLLMGGNHGDEYEGPITLGRMIRELDPATVQGRLIVVPAANVPAVAAGQRTSPVDGKNFNRCFPGDPGGSLTEQIVHYVHDVLFPMADAFLDLHSGGSSLEMIPSAIVEPSDDPEQMDRILRAVLAFDAPLTVVLNNLGDPRTSTAAAVRAGLTVVGTELGSAGAVSIDGLAVCARGVRGVLAHLGVIEATGDAPSGEPRTTLIHVPGPAGYVYAPAAGVFEPFRRLWDEVEAGEPAGAVHFLDDPGRPPEIVRFKHAGTVFSRRAPGRVVGGNCVAVVGAPYRRP